MNILLVEDNTDVSEITVEYLRELGHECVAVESAEDGLKRCTETRFDAVLTDVRLPGMSGIDLARALSRAQPKLPVIIASGYGSLSAELLKGDKLPCVLSLPKPYDLDQLEQTLKQAATLAAAS
jgi:CheY-like chemotaxis protein